MNITSRLGKARQGQGRRLTSFIRVNDDLHPSVSIHSEDLGYHRHNVGIHFYPVIRRDLTVNKSCKYGIAYSWCCERRREREEEGTKEREKE